MQKSLRKNNFYFLTKLHFFRVKFVRNTQLELAFELESDLRDSVDWGKKWLVDFVAGKTKLVSFDHGFIDVKMDGSLLEEK